MEGVRPWRKQGRKGDHGGRKGGSETMEEAREEVRPWREEGRK